MLALVAYCLMPDHLHLLFQLGEEAALSNLMQRFGSFTGLQVHRQTGVGGLLAINLVLTFVIPGLSIGGHLGGLAGGTAVGSVMLQARPSRRATVEGIVFAILVAGAAVSGALWAAHR